jgi:hypothetical protein
MIWATRRFAAADYAPYQDRLGELMWANTPLHGQFMMASVETDRTREVNAAVQTEEITKQFVNLSRSARARLTSLTPS